MSAESDLYAVLSGNAGVLALVSTRIYPDAMPEDGAYPAVVFVRENTEPVFSIGSQYFGSNVDLQVGCWAATRTSADAVGVAVTAALTGAGHGYTARASGYDPETGLFATLVNVTLFEQP